MCIHVPVCACVLSHVQAFVTPWTIACQASLSMNFPRQEYWSGLPFPAPGDLPEPGVKPMSLVSRALAGSFFTSWATGDTNICNVVVVQSFSCVWLFVTPWTAACQVPFSFIVSWSLLKFMSIKSVMLSNHVILCCPLLLPSSFPASVFSSEPALHIRWPNCRSFSISPSNEYSGLISFRIDWFNILAVQGTLKCLL